ncbi:MAG TPA: lytic transglycosylase domain-containing protein [Afifellaceae bacterium]|nr:lytic transglycosylase domain-containing protein [Afifellaceae bacterium]
MLAEPSAIPAAPAAQAERDEPASFATLCALIEAQASRHKLPPSFFTRLLWKESLLDPDAVSPKGAQGIAQFMPGTAAELGLLDPFDPDEAIPHSARFLRKLHVTFGNLGLAAAAYNAGPQRVTAWLSGRSSLPAETRNYVLFVTGRAAADWQAAKGADEPLAAQEPQLDMACNDFVALASRGLVGGTRAARSLPRAPAVARHPGHKIVALASPVRGGEASGPSEASAEPVVLRLKGSGRPAYAVQGGVRSHAEARKTCGRLRASGSYCIVVIR